jgi:putative DNA primase/helicase
VSETDIKEALRRSIEEPTAPAFSEEALAIDFASRHADDLRHVAAWNKWFIWDGTRWQVDETRNVFSMSREICREAAAASNEDKKGSESKRLASAKTRAAVVSLASEDRKLAATIDQWDADPWRLNTPGGVVDLHTGKLCDHNPEDYMTKITAVAPNGPCPQWRKFIAKITGDDDDLSSFLARMCGYALTGLTKEHAMFFLFGLGANGKSVFLETISGIVGDYHRVAPVETFTDSPTDRHPTELAMLQGARLVTATETEEGRRWAESRIKQLTGGDKITARFMRQDFFKYVPQFKLIIAGNHKPGLRSVHEAIRRRLNMIPFAITIPKEERVLDLSERLKEEWPGILKWMIDGCLDWQKKGLAPPNAVTTATELYLKDEDVMLTWMDECCERDTQASTVLGTLHSSFKVWAEGRKEFVPSSKRFGQQIEGHGFRKRHTRNGTEVEGLKLKGYSSEEELKRRAESRAANASVTM